MWHTVDLVTPTGLSQDSCFGTYAAVVPIWARRRLRRRASQASTRHERKDKGTD